MARIEKFRESLQGALTAEYLQKMQESGWRPVLVEWQREIEGGAEPQPPRIVEEIPFGLRVSKDCHHLEQNPEEVQVLLTMMEELLADRGLSQVANEVNRRGFRTRQGAEWSPIGVFNMLPRLVEVGPQIFSSEEWVERRRNLYAKILAMTA